MSTLKCKMCGGNLEFEQGTSVCTCEYCGTKQTLPRLDDEKKANLYDRADHFRRNNEYDKAMAIYEQILEEDTTDAESYWSLILCRYGIEYVEDPATHKRVPTVNRAQFTAVVADEDYKKALEYADIEQKILYEEEAKKIDEIQKGILEISQKEEPFDIFICYKETDNDGRRTMDSVIAYDLYKELIQEGFKVFFSRVTLEDKIGTAYEPYIFSALNSAKVMVVVGTRPEHFNAVWVRNEWSRYLALIRNGENKTLIPAYKNMDPYDLPEEFSHLQGQDMDKLGFMQDLVKGIKKLLKKEDNSTAGYSEGDLTALLQSGNDAIRDGDWKKAGEIFDQALNMEPECAEAYYGLFLADNEGADLKQVFDSVLDDVLDAPKEKKSCIEDLEKIIGSRVQQYTVEDYLEEEEVRDVYSFDPVIESEPALEQDVDAFFSQASNYTNLTRAKRYAKGDFKTRIEAEVSSVNDALAEQIRQQKTNEEETIRKKKKEFEDFLNVADQKAQTMYEQACDEKDSDYQACVEYCENASTEEECLDAVEYMTGFQGYRDADYYIEKTERLAEQLAEALEIKAKVDEQHAAEEAAELKAREEAEEKRKDAKERKNSILAFFISLIAHAGLVCLVLLVPAYKDLYTGTIKQYLIAQAVVLVYCLTIGLCARVQKFAAFSVLLYYAVFIGKAVMVLRWGWGIGYNKFMTLFALGLVSWIIFYFVFNLSSGLIDET